MKNKNRKKGFSALVFVIVMSSVLAFLIANDSFEENALESQLDAVKKHYEKFYAKESESALFAIEKIRGGSEGL